MIFNQPGALPEAALRDLIAQAIALEIPPQEQQGRKPRQTLKRKPKSKTSKRKTLIVRRKDAKRVIIFDRSLFVAEFPLLKKVWTLL